MKKAFLVVVLLLGVVFVDSDSFSDDYEADDSSSFSDATATDEEDTDFELDEDEGRERDEVDCKGREIGKWFCDTSIQAARCLGNGRHETRYCRHGCYSDDNSSPDKVPCSSERDSLCRHQEVDKWFCAKPSMMYSSDTAVKCHSNGKSETKYCIHGCNFNGDGSSPCYDADGHD